MHSLSLILPSRGLKARWSQLGDNPLGNRGPHLAHAVVPQAPSGHERPLAKAVVRQLVHQAVEQGLRAMHNPEPPPSCQEGVLCRRQMTNPVHPLNGKYSGLLRQRSVQPAVRCACSGVRQGRWGRPLATGGAVAGKQLP